MSLLKVNEIQVFNGTTVTITATTAIASADLTVTDDLDVGGALTLGTALAIAEGGTGATTASAARTALGLAIGTDVQAYDADTAKYDDTTANFTGTLQNGGSNVVVDSDIGSTVQAYDADLSVIAGLSNADGNFIVGSATGWTVESGATARTSLGLGTLATQSTITESQISDLGSYITASSTDALTNKSGNISQWTNDSGYLTAETNDLGSAVTGTLGVANGGTGLTAIGTANQVLAVNAGATALEFQTLGTGGTVTSVAVSGSDGIEVDSGSPITTSGTITLGINAATLSSHLSLGTAATTASTDYATAAQGALADSAVQPGDDAADLGSGAATDGYVLTADGAGGAAWEAASGGAASLPIDLLSSGASIRKSDGTTAVLSESGGAVTLENVANAYLSGGVYLGGTGAANYLQDYETGTWTPTGNNVTYILAEGYYIKIGKLVHVEGIAIFPTTSDTNYAKIQNFPFEIVNYGGLAIGSESFSGSQISILCEPGTYTVTFRDGNIKTNANLSDTGFFFGGTYITS